MTLWRTSHTNFSLYSPDGLGRDQYIFYNNGGFWSSNQYHISKKPDFEYNHYTNFHSLNHMAAPFKYYSDGTGRDSYIKRATGLSHDERPLASFHLTDFLRSGQSIRKFNNRKALSLAEQNFNRQRRFLERKMIKRLYTDPLEKILAKKKASEEKAKEDGLVEIPLRENPGFNIYDKIYDGNEILENDEDVDKAFEKSKGVEKFEIKDEKSLIHVGNHGYLRTSYDLGSRYSLEAKPKKNIRKKIINTKISIDG